MWINSTQREEPYLGLNCLGYPQKRGVPFGDPSRGAAWLSSARVVRCWVKSRNERNPRPVLPFWDSQETASDKLEEGGDDVKSSWPLWLGLHTYYNGKDRGPQSREGEPIPETFSQSGSESATRLREVGIASNRRSALLR